MKAWECKHKKWHTSRVVGSILTGGKLFAEYILLSTTKQYKNTNIANFVQLQKDTNI